MGMGPLINEGVTVELCSTERDRMLSSFEGILDEMKIG